MKNQEKNTHPSPIGVLHHLDSLPWVLHVPDINLNSPFTFKSNILSSIWLLRELTMKSPPSFHQIQQAPSIKTHCLDVQHGAGILADGNWLCLRNLLALCGVSPQRSLLQYTVRITTVTVLQDMHSEDMVTANW